MMEFFTVLFTAVLLRNAYLTRGLGSDQDTFRLDTPRKILLFGGTLTFITTFSNLLIWPFTALLRKHRDAFVIDVRFLIYFVTLAGICFLFALCFLLTRAYLPRLHYTLRDYMIPATFNSAVLGGILIAGTGGSPFLRSVAYTIGSCVGYTLALLLIREGKQRIALSDVPRAFRGMPVMLLYAGILSLAIYGLIGHQLPT